LGHCPKKHVAFRHREGPKRPRHICACIHKARHSIERRAFALPGRLAFMSFRYRNALPTPLSGCVARGAASA
jgi:hypothetical protein